MNVERPAAQRRLTDSRRRVLSLLPVAGAACGLAACGSGGGHAQMGGTSTGAALLATPAKNEWPDRFWRAAPDVQDAYRFALANKDTLQYMPCYCGCIGDGHTSNYDCYVKEARADGSYILEPMSFG